jgi:hypothetical protein
MFPHVRGVVCDARELLLVQACSQKQGPGLLLAGRLVARRDAALVHGIPTLQRTRGYRTTGNIHSAFLQNDQMRFLNEGVSHPTNDV